MITQASFMLVPSSEREVGGVGGTGSHILFRGWSIGTTRFPLGWVDHQHSQGGVPFF
jgi:hypothetical protein